MPGAPDVTWRDWLGKTFTLPMSLLTFSALPWYLRQQNAGGPAVWEMKEFSGNAVEYFVSYYDYYQPELCTSSDTFIEKDASVNEHIEQMRCPPPKRCWSGVMWLWWRLFPRFMVWAILIYISR
ncbi:UvrABC system protein B (excinuclease ABC subunit B) [Escherichia coli]|uniref:UvrABC system protein B (Excinuclease ABC subunit B) n=1 Tax=Escherichia coli TaxID=562 RepID=A0A484WTA6_ECOLX|nr:UvrABC system protein B (excinuclease ABC subunit B) [Escherichia coli]